MAETFEFGSLEAPAHLIVETGTPEERLRAIAAETRRRAREEGYAEGLAEARAQTASAIDALAAAEQGIRSREEEFLRAAERSAVELAIAIAEKIVGGTVAARPEAVLDVVAGALLRTADNDFYYAFAGYADSGAPVKTLEMRDRAVVDTTRDHQDLIAADASHWMDAFNANSGDGLGFLAAWAADTCLEGRASDAFATLDRLNSEGKLVGGPGHPSGGDYVAALRSFLTAYKYC